MSRGVLYVPYQVRELLRDLEKAGFVNRGGKGSHRNFEHPTGVRVTISGQDGEDANAYQERAICSAIADSEAPVDVEGASDE